MSEWVEHNVEFDALQDLSRTSANARWSVGREGREWEWAALGGRD